MLLDIYIMYELVRILCILLYCSIRLVIARLVLEYAYYIYMHTSSYYWQLTYLSRIFFGVDDDEKVRVPNPNIPQAQSKPR